MRDGLPRGARGAGLRFGDGPSPAAHPRPLTSARPWSAGHESDYQPEPLTVEVQIQLNQCRSAEEALRTLAV